MKNLALLSLKTFSGQGLEKLSEVLQNSKKFLVIRRVSSVYRVERPSESFMSIAMLDGEEQLEGYVVVAEVEYKTSTQALAESLGQLEAEFKDQVTRRTMSINLIAVMGETRKTPMLTLPHPEFHMRPEELIPACELWPDYEHPILKKTISQIAQGLPNKVWGEFYCQGLQLIDTNKFSDKSHQEQK